MAQQVVQVRNVLWARQDIIAVRNRANRNITAFILNREFTLENLKVLVEQMKRCHWLGKGIKWCGLVASIAGLAAVVYGGARSIQVHGNADRTIKDVVVGFANQREVQIGGIVGAGGLAVAVGGAYVEKIMPKEFVDKIWINMRNDSDYSARLANSLEEFRDQLGIVEEGLWQMERSSYFEEVRQCKARIAEIISPNAVGELMAAVENAGILFRSIATEIGQYCDPLEILRDPGVSTLLVCGIIAVQLWKAFCAIEKISPHHFGAFANAFEKLLPLMEQELDAVKRYQDSLGGIGQRQR